jgi:hypothetical protein
MRKVFWCVIPSIALVAASYRAWQIPRETSVDSASSGPSPVCCVAENSEPGDASQGACCCHATSPVEYTQDALFAPRRAEVIELPEAASPAPTAIVIADTQPAPAPLPAVDSATDQTEVAFGPRIMPYCDDDSPALSLMPYANNDVWPATKGLAAQSSDWFEDSEPATDSELLPDNREDENLSRQYPGLPAPGSASPTSNGSMKKISPWQHDKAPILPVTPEGSGPAVPARGKEDGDMGPQALRALPGLLRHTALKLFTGKEADAPARQPVDTLEMRPGDVRSDETVPEDF